MTQTPIEIRFCFGGRERDAAIAYISEKMRKKYGSCPPPETTPPDICLALEKGAIVGALGILFGRTDAPLPIEALFDFDPSLVPVPYVREKTVYYSRWNSSRPGIGLAVWLAASLHAKYRGIVYTAATGKQDMLDYYRERFGCIWHPIPGAAIREACVGESERGYFFGAERPTPWVGILDEQIRELPGIVAAMRKDASIRIEVDI